MIYLIDNHEPFEYSTTFIHCDLKSVEVVVETIEYCLKHNYGEKSKYQLSAVLREVDPKWLKIELIKLDAWVTPFIFFNCSGDFGDELLGTQMWVTLNPSMIVWLHHQWTMETKIMPEWWFERLKDFANYYQSWKENFPNAQILG